MASCGVHIVRQLTQRLRAGLRPASLQMTWPLPVGVGEAKARFVFRDATNNQEVFRFEKEAKFQATMSGGIATKKEQMAHIKGGLADALVKETKHNR